MAWARNGTPNTLGSSADILTITDLNPFTFQQFLLHSLHSGTGDITLRTRYNNDSSGNYARRRNDNGGSDATHTSQSQTYWYGSGSIGDVFLICYQINISDEEKLEMWWNIYSSSSGSGNAPTRMEGVGKWVNTSTQISEIDVENTVGGSSYDTDSNLSALGTD